MFEAALCHCLYALGVSKERTKEITTLFEVCCRSARVLRRPAAVAKVLRLPAAPCVRGAAAAARSGAATAARSGAAAALSGAASVAADRGSGIEDNNANHDGHGKMHGKTHVP